jgi:hypothetical protein
MSEAIEISSPERPLVAVIERAIAMTDAHRVPLQAGGAMVVYDSERRPIEPMPTAVARATLAELVLPLERQRLLALIQHVVDRSDATGRARRKTPPEQRAI